ncbi:MAG: G5 domain-containing protein [Oscillospiraceae bacterium]|nr:G5 domain-containing protein [Oscillospiraceae bacterium]
MPLAIALLLLSQTAFAQTTYVITDGDRVLVHTTSATDPEAVLGEAGLKLGADDTYTTQAVAGVSEITVRRSQNVTIDYYGEVMEEVSFGETVEELLTRLNLSWGPDDTISLSLDTETYDGMELAVARVVHQQQTYTAAVPYETVYCSDPTIPAGQEVVLTAGETGEMVCQAKVTYVNGEEAERTVLSQRVTSQPVDAVVAVGCGAEEEETEMPVIGDGTITLPTGEVLSYKSSMFAGATAYHCEGYVGTTATGTEARVGAIAVDPRVIPYGTRMFIVTNDGEYVYGIATAEDCGSVDHIVGDRVDLYFDTEEECIEFGYRECTIYFLG